MTTISCVVCMVMLGPPSEKLRLKLLEEELKLRKKQPEHWAKSKYRKYANLQSKRKRKREERELEKEQEIIEQAMEQREKIDKKRKQKKKGKR
ncbi:MAG: hypothetical protein N3D73_00715 [Candidatus Diapherotrites archaeon]|nr:hypothetical protein [Candidatus Diapherotrites archaeon]